MSRKASSDMVTFTLGVTDDIAQKSSYKTTIRQADAGEGVIGFASLDDDGALTMAFDVPKSVRDKIEDGGLGIKGLGFDMFEEAISKFGKENVKVINGVWNAGKDKGG